MENYRYELRLAKDLELFLAEKLPDVMELASVTGHPMLKRHYPDRNPRTETGADVCVKSATDAARLGRIQPTDAPLRRASPVRRISHLFQAFPYCLVQVIYVHRNRAA